MPPVDHSDLEVLGILNLLMEAPEVAPMKLRNRLLLGAAQRTFHNIGSQPCANASKMLVFYTLPVSIVVFYLPTMRGNPASVVLGGSLCKLLRVREVEPQEVTLPSARLTFLWGGFVSPYAICIIILLMARDLSDHRKRRIREADAVDLGKLIQQDAYWTKEAYRLILERVDTLIYESPDEADQAARHALQLLGRIADPEPELRALALALHGSALRSLGRYKDALARYSEAIEIPGLSRKGHALVLKRQTVALILNGEISEGLSAIEDALEIEPGDITNLAVRSWARLVTGDPLGTLDDSLLVLEKADIRRDRSSFLAGIVNTAAVLRLEAVPVDPRLTRRVAGAIDECRAQVPRSGSSFYTLTLVRGLLYRAEGILHGCRGRHREGLRLLRLAYEKLVDKYPDDAIFTAVDMICLYARTDQTELALKTCRSVLDLADRTNLRLYHMGLAVTRLAIDRGTLSESQAVEIRSLLHIV